MVARLRALWQGTRASYWFYPALFTLGAVNGVAFLVVICMTLITAPLGVKLAHAMDPKPLKRVFAVFLTLVALNMLRKALGW